MDKLSCVRVVSLCLASLLVLATTMAAEDMNGPPARPDVFRSPQELRDYLKALNEYFAIVGRPRFGRSAAKRSLLAIRRTFGGPVFSEIDLDEQATG